MKKQLFSALTVFILFLIPNVNFGQTAPDLGATSGFAVFTGTGASFTNSGATSVTGDIGASTASTYNFTGVTLNGNSYSPGSAEAANAAVDVLTAYSDLEQGGAILGVTITNGQIITKGVWQTGAAATLSGTVTLDAEDDPNAIFIIRIGGAFTTDPSSNVILIRSASLCNVYWQVDGAVSLGGSSIFMGTIISRGAITLLAGSNLFGRALTTAGAIALDNNEVSFMPTAAGTITGITSVCQGRTGVDYSVPLIEDAESYNWTLPSGATGSSSTNSITVDYGSSAVSGDISVKGYNSCGGYGTISNLAITVNPLPTSSAIYHQ